MDLAAVGASGSQEVLQLLLAGAVFFVLGGVFEMSGAEDKEFLGSAPGVIYGKLSRRRHGGIKKRW